MNAELELAREIGALSRDPLRFVQAVFPWGKVGGELETACLRAFQTEVLSTIRDHLQSPQRYTPLQLAIASGHGIGKSALIAWVMAWGLSTCEDCRITVTAGTGKQLDTKTWPEVTKWFNLLVNRHWWQIKAESICSTDKRHERLWRADAVTWSEQNMNAFAGLHNQGKRLIVIYDEAAGIADRVWEVTSGALTDTETEIIWIAFGQPSQNTGRFFECFNRFKHRWDRKQIDSRTVPGTNKELFRQWVEDYGEDSDYVRVRVRGVFPRAGSTQFISGEVVREAQQRVAVGYEQDFKVLSVDVARFGDDQTVIGMRQGRKLTVLERLRGLDTMQVAMRVKGHIERERPRLTVVDGDGLGAGVVDWLRMYGKKWFESPNRLFEFHGGASPQDGDMYYNQRAECWGLMREWLKTGSIPDEVEVEQDLTGPEYFFSSRNQVQLERKEDMKKRGLSSPDIGDMIAMTFAANPRGKTFDERLLEKIESTVDPMEQHWLRLAETERRQKACRARGYWE